ncbi:amidohydrolase family protein [Natrarchaeobius oligotrophus]|nr:amidohydrolase family protein [Natrarchaeobius chitinivorans]
MVMDTHIHYFGQSMMDELNEMIVDEIGSHASIKSFYESEDLGFTTEEADERVEMMDEWGQESAVLSFPSPESFIDAEYLKQPSVYGAFSRIVNDNLAEIHEQHPDRLYGYASVPLVDADAAIEELDRAIDDLGLQGVCLDSNVFGQYLSEEPFRPFFEHANDRNVPVFIHPTNPAGKERMTRYYTESMVGFPTDTALVASYMIYSGFMEAYDDLEIILSHLGGTLPYIRRRLEFLYSENDPAFAEHQITTLDRHPPSYLDDFWYDTAMTFPRAMEMTHDLVGDRLVFGSDFPFGPKDSPATTQDQIAELELSAESEAALMSENLEEILLNI